MMIDKNLIEALYNYTKTHPDVTESEMLAYTVANSDHTHETAAQWFNAFYVGLFESMILDEPSFAGLVNKMTNIEALSSAVIIRVMEDYLNRNPLPYQIQQRLMISMSERAEVEQEPDMVENELKTMRLAELDSKISRLNEMLQ